MKRNRLNFTLFMLSNNELCKLFYNKFMPTANRTHKRAQNEDIKHKPRQAKGKRTMRGPRTRTEDKAAEAAQNEADNNV